MSKKNPYLDARREWNERYGNYVVAAKFNRNIAYICAMIALIAVGGSIFLKFEKKIIPYVVEIDQTGVVRNVQPIGQVDEEIQRRVIKATGNQFIQNWRGVSLDAKVQGDKISNVYVHLRQGSPAFNKITAYFSENDPFVRARTETVAVNVTRLLSLGELVWELEWTEYVMDRRTGEETYVHNYRVVMHISIAPPTDTLMIIANPLGIIINDVNWSQQL